MNQADKDYRFSAYIGPLIWGEARPDLPVEARGEPTLESLLRFLTHPDEKVDLDRYVQAYGRISAKEPMGQLFAAPYEPNILAKLIWPLRHAKANYVLGNYVDTVALCGMVAEMVTILLMEFHFQKTLSDPEVRKALDIFEREYQTERITAILNAGAIDSKQADRLREISRVRNQTLHIFSERLVKPEDDAYNVFGETAQLVGDTLVEDIRDGKLVLKPGLMEYLRRRALINPV